MLLPSNYLHLMPAMMDSSTMSARQLASSRGKLRDAGDNKAGYIMADPGIRVQLGYDGHELTITVQRFNV